MGERAARVLEAGTGGATHKSGARKNFWPGARGRASKARRAELGTCSAAASELRGLEGRHGERVKEIWWWLRAPRAP